MKVLVREEIAPAGVELLRSRFEVDVDGESDLAEIIGGYDAIVIRSATKLTADLIERGERLRVIGRACRAGAKAMGLELFSPDEDRSAVVTGILTPEGVDAGELRLTLRDRFGITLAGGQGDLKDRLFRIGHIGYYDVFDITTALAAVELALTEAGAEIERGAAVTAALDAYAAPARV